MLLYEVHSAVKTGAAGWSYSLRVLLCVYKMQERISQIINGDMGKLSEKGDSHPCHDPFFLSFFLVCRVRHQVSLSQRVWSSIHEVDILNIIINNRNTACKSPTPLSFRHKHTHTHTQTQRVSHSSSLNTKVKMYWKKICVIISVGSNALLCNAFL